jgi:hypothetical protein
MVRIKALQAWRFSAGSDNRQEERAAGMPGEKAQRWRGVAAKKDIWRKRWYKGLKKQTGVATSRTLLKGMLPVISAIPPLLYSSSVDARADCCAALATRKKEEKKRGTAAARNERNPLTTHLRGRSAWRHLSISSFSWTWWVGGRAGARGQGAKATWRRA